MRWIPCVVLVMLAAASPARDSADFARLGEVLGQLGVDAAPESLAPAPIDGFVEISRGMQVLYVSVDGRMLIDGDILSLATETNLTEQRRAAIRRGILADIAEEDRLRLPSPAPSAGRIVVFTDTDCPYCARFHRQRDELLQRGIEIQYLFFPRPGPSSGSWDAAVSVWCSHDRLAALEALLNGEAVSRGSCRHPVAEHYAAARRLDLRGTPAIVLPDGSIRYGSVEAGEILDALTVSSD